MDGHSSHVVHTVVEHIELHSRTIYGNTGKSLSKPVFWELLSHAYKVSLTASNILAGFKATGLYPLCPERVLKHISGKVSGAFRASETSRTPLATPSKMASLREKVQRLGLTPQVCSTVEEYGSYIESKLIFHRTIQSYSAGLKVLRSGKQIASRSTKRIKGPQVLDRAYVVCEQARIATQEVEEAEKAERATVRIAKKLEKELQAEKQALRGRGGRGGRGGQNLRVD